MKVIIDTIDQVKEIEIDKENFFIGLDTKCDVQLPYEGVGQEHIQIYLLDNKLFVRELGSGFDTVIDGRLIAAGSVVEIEATSTIDIAGIHIKVKDYKTSTTKGLELEEDSLLAEEELEQQETDLKDLSSLFEDVAEEVDNSNSTPNLEAVDLNLKNRKESQSRKIKVVRSDHKRTTKKRTKSNRKLLKKNKVSEKNMMFNIAALLIAAFISCYYYYNNVYIKNLKQKNILSNKVVPNQLVFPKYFKPNEKIVYEMYFKQKICEGSEFCHYNKKFHDQAKSQYARLEGDHLFFGVNKLELENIFKKLTGQLEKISAGELEQQVQEKYTDFFNLEAFKSNDNKAPISSFKFSVDKNQDVLTFILLVLNETSRDFSKLNNITFFIFNKFENEIEILNEFHFDPIIFNYKKEFLKEEKKDLSMIINNYLSIDIDSFISSYGHNSSFSFDKAMLTKRLKEKNARSYKDLFAAEKNKCKSLIALNICNEIQAKRELHDHEGAIRIEDKLVIYLNYDHVLNAFKPEVEKSYSNLEKLTALDYYNKQERDQSKRLKFRENNYKLIENTSFDRSVDLLLIDAFKSGYLSKLTELRDIKEFVFIGFTKLGSIKGTTVISSKQLKMIANKGLIHEDIFWNSAISIFPELIPR